MTQSARIVDNRSTAPRRSGDSSTTAAMGSPFLRFNRAGTVRIVNFVGSSRRETSFQESGVDTVAPGIGRGMVSGDAQFRVVRTM